MGRARLMSKIGPILSRTHTETSKKYNTYLQVEPAGLQHLEHQKGAQIVHHVHHHRAIEVASMKHGP